MSKGSFEAKLHAFRRTQDGVVVSYVIHPSDVSAELATASLGTRYMIGFSEIGDDEKELGRGQEPPSVSGANPDGEREVSDSAAAFKAVKKRFVDLPFPQQAAIRCSDEGFQFFIHADDEESAAKQIREYCAVKSRSEILPGTQAAKLWCDLEDLYQKHITQERYADSLR